CSYSSDIVPGTGNTCDPDSSHSLTVITPYNGNSDQVLVRIDDNLGFNLSRVIGVAGVHTAARAVAHRNSGGVPFGFALYAERNLTTNGNLSLQVGGNVFVTGCVILTNADELITFSQGGEPGNIQVYDD